MKKLIDDIINCPPVWTIRILAASILSLFSIYTAFFGVFPDMIQRSFHIGIILFLVYLISLFFFLICLEVNLFFLPS